MKLIQEAYIKIVTESEIEHGESLSNSDGTKYQTPNGYIDIQHKNLKYSPRSQSVVGFVVDEKSRGKGIGKALLAHAIKKHDDLGAQVSSAASVKVFHDAGFRNPEIPNGSFQDHENKRQEDSSIFMAHKNHIGEKYV